MKSTLPEKPFLFEETQLSANMEDYMETISLLARKSKVVRVKDIAKNLNIKMPSVSAALHKLKDLDLITYEKYGYIELTDEGEKIAQKVYQKHSCIADFLFHVLQLNRRHANDEACKLEHYLSASACSQIQKFMDFYSKEKDKNATWIRNMHSIMKHRFLSTLSQGDNARIIKAGHTTETQKSFQKKGIIPDAHVFIKEYLPEKDSIVVLCNEKEISLTIAEASDIITHIMCSNCT